MDDPRLACPIHDVQRLIGGKWSLVVLWHLARSKRRFAELERAIGDVSAKALTENLRALEHEGLVHRAVFAEVPPRVEYSLTELGRTLVPLVDAIQAWGEAHRGEIEAARARTRGS